MMKKLALLSFFVFSCFLSFTQTDKYTEKLQKLFAEEEYYKVIDYKSDQESEMASVSLYFKGIACFQVRNYRRAISYFDNAIQKGDPLADVYYYKGACHLILEEYDESVAELTRAVEMEPGESEYLSLLGRTYFYQEKFDAALV
ncbi:MAG: tetratricopeptide repeat protein, partial [Bacteroidetes bacterium]|nr:tetratricopeptide repeat protein [Bacteroidota bacterium]